MRMTHELDAIKIDEELDLRGVVCPYNYVKTKLKLEEMTTGQVLRVTIDDGEPVRNVPRSVTDEGHQVLKIEPYHGHHRVTIRKCVD
jgi:TusA-related sulfurtransferase